MPTDTPRQTSYAMATLRTFWVLVFFAGAAIHLVRGRSSTAAPDYAAFGETALVPALSQLWTQAVIPQIGLFTAAMSALEAGVAVALCRAGRWCHIGATVALAFFCFLIVLGYGWPTDSLLEDIAKNRIGSLILIALMLPCALAKNPASLAEVWRHAKCPTSTS